jgi:hypothetical protein
LLSNPFWFGFVLKIIRHPAVEQSPSEEIEIMRKSLAIGGALLALAAFISTADARMTGGGISMSAPMPHGASISSSMDRRAPLAPTPGVQCRQPLRRAGPDARQGLQETD